MNKYVVETVSIFRIRYVVEAKESSHATDEVVMGLSNTKFDEFSQHHVDEVISSVRQITDDEYFKMFDEDNAYLKNWPDEKKLRFIQKIDYGSEALQDSVCGDSECCNICIE